MKRFKKMMAIAIACAMIIGTVSFGMIGTFADEIPSSQNYQSPIRITGLTEGDVVNFYKVVEWVGDTDQSSYKGWKAVAPFDSVLDQAALKKMLGDSSATPAIPASGMTAALAGQLARLVDDQTTIAGTDTVGSDKIAEMSTREKGSGMYLALITPKDANTVYSPVFVSANYGMRTSSDFAIPGSDSSYSDSAAAKKSEVKVTKTASTSEDENDDKKPQTTAVGDIVTYTVEAVIPSYGTYETPHYTLTDKLTALKLTDTANSFKVEVDGSALATSNYTTTGVSDGSTGYTIEFTPAYLKTLTTATTVTITYKALVTTDAAANVSEEDNQVSITYSHNPNKEEDYDVKKDTTQHYTFSLDAEALGLGQNLEGKKGSELVKVGLNKDGSPIIESTVTSTITASHSVQSPLEGAEFKLYTNEACTQEYQPKDADGNNVDKLTLRTGADGRMTISGLDAGSYWLKETKAPAGYVTDDHAIPIVIKATMKTVSVTEWYKDGSWSSTDNGGKKVTYETEVLDKYTVTVNGQTAATHTFINPSTSTAVNWVKTSSSELPYSIKNVKGLELPSTGGMGTTLFYIIGAILIIGAGVLLVTRRRTESAE